MISVYATTFARVSEIAPRYARQAARRCARNRQDGGENVVQVEANVGPEFPVQSHVSVARA
jgi:hypothetical protein